MERTEKIVPDREKFEIEGVRDRESPLYMSHPNVTENTGCYYKKNI